MNPDEGLNRARTLLDGGMNSQRSLGDATLEELASALTTKLDKERDEIQIRLEKVQAAEAEIEAKLLKLEAVQKQIFAMTDLADEIVELNVGGVHMSTSRSVLCSAEGSLLSGMFSGNFENGHKRDRDGRIFLDIDPPLFAKVLSHLRLRRIAGPEAPAPLPQVSEECRAEYEMMVKYFGLETFMYGGDGFSNGNIFASLADLEGVDQSKLQTNNVVRITLSSTGGVPASSHEEVLSETGFSERSLENSYGAQQNTIGIKFLKHKVRVEGMEMRAKVSDVLAHMSNQWTFRHGASSINMSYPFSRLQPNTGRLETPNLGPAFVSEVIWVFPRDFCLEHIVLYGRVAAK